LGILRPLRASRFERVGKEHQMRKYAPETSDEKKSLLTESRRAQSALTRADSPRGGSLVPHAEALLSATNGRLDRASDTVLQMQQHYGNRYVQRVVQDARDLIAQRRSSSGEREQGQKNGSGLPDRLKAGIEHLSGESMSDVQVHYNSQKPAQIKALAYTEGSEIHVGPGLEQNLPHEAWHVVQQKQGRVKPTMEMKGYLVNDDESLESEATTMGDRASSMQPGPRLPGSEPRGASSPSPARGRTVQAARKPGQSVIQRVREDKDLESGNQVQLRTTEKGRKWKLALVDKDENELAMILFVLETSLIGKLPKLSVDSMQSRQKSGGGGTELMANIPWAVEKIVRGNPFGTRAGNVTLHSGFGNIIAYQMAVKSYANKLNLRDTPSWKSHNSSALGACDSLKESLKVVDKSEELALSNDDDLEVESPKNEDLQLSNDDDLEVESPKNEDSQSPKDDELKVEPPKSEPKLIGPSGYDMTKFPELWADSQVLIESEMFEIDAHYLRGSVDQVAKKLFNQLHLFDRFSAVINVKNLSAFRSEVQTAKREAQQKLAAKNE
jgi:hypothetical protein